MRRAATAGLLILCGLAGSVCGADGVKINGSAGPQTKFDPYRLVRLKTDVKDPKAGIAWRVREVGGDGSKVDWASGKDGAEVVFVAPPGKYAVDVIVGTVDEKGKLKLDVDELVIEVAQPSGPLPPPKPKPDEPDTVVDPLTKAVQDAYDTEQLDTRAADLTKLKTAMTTATILCDSASYSSRAQLVSAVNVNAKAVVGAGRLASVGAVIGKYLDKTLGTDDGALTPDLRAKYKAAYNDVLKALGEVK